MSTSSLQRAATDGLPRSDRWFLFTLLPLRAVGPTLLVIGVGMVSVILLQRQETAPRAWWLSELAGQMSFLDSPWLATPEWRLLAVCGIGLTIWLMDTMLRLGTERYAESILARTTCQLRRHVYQKSLALGPFSVSSGSGQGHATLPEDLFFETTESVQRGLYARYVTRPLAALTIVALLSLVAVTNLWLAILAVLLALVVRRSDTVEAQRREESQSRHAVRLGRLRRVLSGLLRPTPSVLKPAVSTKVLEQHLTKWEQERRHGERAKSRYHAKLAATRTLACLFFLLVTVLTPQTNVASATMIGLALSCCYLPGKRFWDAGRIVADAHVAADQVYAFLDRPSDVIQPPNAKPLGRVSKAIQLVDVTINGQPQWHPLRDVTLTIPAGSTVAILSTDERTVDILAGLFLRLADPTSGRLLFDETDLRSVTLDSLREQAALIDYQGIVFDGTASDNISCGDTQYSVLQITEAARLAGVYDYLAGLEQGFSTMLGPETEIPPIRRLQIAAARALLRNPSVLVAKEPNFTDQAGNNAVTELFRRLRQQRTLLICASRMETLRTVDQVFLFADGRLQAHGSHTDLLKQSELYRHWNYIRFNPHRQIA